MTKNLVVKSCWVQRVRYLNDEASIEIILTYDVVNEITRIESDLLSEKKQAFYLPYLEKLDCY